MIKCPILVGGGGSSVYNEWQPHPDWWDIETVLMNDTENYAGKWICLIPNVEKTTTFTVNSNIVAYKTSDGSMYTSTTTHTWDETKDKDCSDGYKTRYIIYYSNSENSPTNTQFDSYYVNVLSLYIIFNINIVYGYYFLRNFYLLQSFKFINNKNFNTTTMSNFCNNNYSLKKIPDNLYTSNVTNFNQFCYYCYSLKIAPSLDFSNATNLSSLYGYCYNLISILGVIDFTKLTSSPSNIFTQTYQLVNYNIINTKYSISFSNMINSNHQSLLNLVNGLVDLKSSSIQTLTIGTNLISKLTIAERSIAINKNWNLA